MFLLNNVLFRIVFQLLKYLTVFACLLLLSCFFLFKNFIFIFNFLFKNYFEAYTTRTKSLRHKFKCFS